MNIIIKKLLRKMERIVTRAFLRMRWVVCSHIPQWRGITEKTYQEEVVVSLTSFPARIGSVKEAIKTLLMQNQKPNHIILWLAREQFPQAEGSLPMALLKLQRYGLEIKWCDDIRSYKKLIPTLSLYPEAVIITADDDLYYRCDWLKVLYDEHLKHPDMICAHRVTKFYLENDFYKVIRGGYDIWPEATYLNELTGGAGALFPPRVLDENIFDKDVFMAKCSTNDDIWFWLMAVLHGTKICVPQKANPNIIYILGTQKGPTLTRINNEGSMLFWRDFQNMLNQYPTLDHVLREEYKRLTCKGELNAEKSN